MSRIPSLVTLPASLGPHSIALLLAASAIFSSGLIARTNRTSNDSHGLTAECAVLEQFLGSPDVVANFKGTSEELQRLVDTFYRDCN